MEVFVGLAVTTTLELVGAAGILVAGLVPLALGPTKRLARAFFLLAFLIAVNAALASLGEARVQFIPLASRLVPYATFGTLGAGMWFAAVLLDVAPMTRRLAGAGAVLTTGVLGLLYGNDHDLWRTEEGAGPLHVARGARYLMHGLLALTAAVVAPRSKSPLASLIALGFLTYATHETIRWLLRIPLFSWGDTTSWNDASYVLRLTAGIPLGMALATCRSIWGVRLVVPLLAACTTAALRYSVSVDAFSSSALEIAEVEYWRTTSYCIVAAGVWQVVRLQRDRTGDVPE